VELARLQRDHRRYADLRCIGGLAGKACGSDGDCGGVPGACDACTLYGGVTTEDEMFILTGSYYWVSPS
jgi:hypothetical protein